MKRFQIFFPSLIGEEKNSTHQLSVLHTGTQREPISTGLETPSFPRSLIPSLPHYLVPLFPCSLIPSLPHSYTPSLPHFFNPSFRRSFITSHTHSLPPSLFDLLTASFSHSLAYIMLVRETHPCMQWIKEKAGIEESQLKMLKCMRNWQNEQERIVWSTTEKN